MNLLQGFNLTSNNSINNIVKILNTEFDTAFEENFTDEDFQKLLGFFGAYNNQGSINRIMDRFTVKVFSYQENIEGIINKINIHPDTFERYRELFTKNFTNFTSDKEALLASGISIYINKERDHNNEIVIDISPEMFPSRFSLVYQLVQSAYINPKPHFLCIHLERNFLYYTDPLRISALLINDSDFSLSEKKNGSYQYKDIKFSIYTYTHNANKIKEDKFYIHFNDKTESTQIIETIEALYNVGVIYPKYLR